MRSPAFATIDMILAAAIVAGTGTIVSPVITRTRTDREASTCQRNLRQIGIAVRLYAEDHSGRLPTNRPSPMGPPSQQAFLTPAGQPQRQASFVEGIELYLPRAHTPHSLVPVLKTGDERSVWTCPAVTKYYPTKDGHIPGWGDSRVCYGMNFSLLEVALADVPDPRKTLLFREMDWRGQSYCVGYFRTAGAKPTAAFLGHADSPYPKTRHGRGSYILFVDGHVDWFSFDVARAENLRNDTAERPGVWALCEDNDPAKPLLWYTLPRR